MISNDKDKGGYSNLNSSTFSQVLGISIKKTCLFLLNVAGFSDRLTLLTLLVKSVDLKVPSPRQSGFRKGDSSTLLVLADINSAI